jgi:hypothetical protein
VDNFCKGFKKWYVKQLINDGMLNRNSTMQVKLSEIITIVIIYDESVMGCFKHYCLHLKSEKSTYYKILVQYDSFIRYFKKAFL